MNPLLWTRSDVCDKDKYSPFVSQSQEALLEHCRQAGITFMVLVSDKEGNYLKVNHINTCAEDTDECGDLTSSRLFLSGEVFWERPSVGEENSRIWAGRSLHPKEPDQTLRREKQVTYTDVCNRRTCQSPEETSNAVLSLIFTRQRDFWKRFSSESKGIITRKLRCSFSDRIMIHIFVF